MAQKTAGYTRWAAWEQQVLAKVSSTPKRCRAAIQRRQKEVDDDDSEADLVARYFREQLRHEHKQNPDTCHVFIPMACVTDWVEKATSLGLAKTKVTPYLTAIGIPELSERRTNQVRGWCWRGLWKQYAGSGGLAWPSCCRWWRWRRSTAR